ncbi:MAG: NAD(P)H-dependent glycerol-3-phosphate dehydrogenase [Paracoccaceae bacterium]
MKVAILGAGAFGTAIAVALAAGGETVGLWARSADHAEKMRQGRENQSRLPGVTLPKNVSISAEIEDFRAAETLVLAMPTQQLSSFVESHLAQLRGKNCVLCAKGIDLETGRGPTAILRGSLEGSHPAILTGPSFAQDIARGLPTALTLACDADKIGEALQALLSTPDLRIYRTTDTTGAELGGALKNVMAIAAGIVIGAGLGDSARAALMARGFSEMARLAIAFGGRFETITGLSGLGDLILTCTSEQSRNFRFGAALGAGRDFDPTITVEGVATSKAVVRIAEAAEIDMPISAMVAALVDRKIDVSSAVTALMARPLKKE